MELRCVWARSFLTVPRASRKIPVDQKCQKHSDFDDFDYPKIPTLQPHIRSPNRMHRNDAGAMTNCFMGFGTGSELSIENDRWK